jgi:hypothetical protein
MTVLAAVIVMSGACVAGVAGAPASPLAGGSDLSVQPATEPPARPLRVTAEQMAALERLAEQPAYAVGADTRAAYSFEAQKQATEISAVGFYFGYAGTIAAILIAAAPL